MQPHMIIFSYYLASQYLIKLCYVNNVLSIPYYVTVSFILLDFMTNIIFSHFPFVDFIFLDGPSISWPTYIVFSYFLSVYVCRYKTMKLILIREGLVHQKKKVPLLYLKLCFLQFLHFYMCIIPNCYNV